MKPTRNIYCFFHEHKTREWDHETHKEYLLLFPWKNYTHNHSQKFCSLESKEWISYKFDSINPLPLCFLPFSFDLKLWFWKEVPKGNKEAKIDFPKGVRTWNLTEEKIKAQAFAIEDGMGG